VYAVTQLRNNSKLLANPAVHLFLAGLLAASVLFTTTAQAAAQRPVNPGAKKLKEFGDRIGKYVDLQNKLDGRLPSQAPSNDPGKAEAHRKALADAIRKARADARIGDVFGDTAGQFRLIIEQDARDRSVRDAFAAMLEVPKSVTPRVNAEYPEQAPLATVPPLILARLQPLPDGLEYRFMGRDLILRDTKANLIVDVVHDAVPTIRR
jgi:hypothetical protein